MKAARGKSGSVQYTNQRPANRILVVEYCYHTPSATQPVFLIGSFAVFAYWTLGPSSRAGRKSLALEIVHNCGGLPHPGFDARIADAHLVMSWSALWTTLRTAQTRIVGGPAIAPDGRRIAFSVEDNGRTLLYAMDNDGSHLRVLADSLALRGNPGWAPDGRFLVYSGADVGTTFPLRAAAADGRPYPLPSVMLTRGARRVAFFRDPQALVILSGEIGHKNFSLLDLRTGSQRILADLPANFVIRDFDISAAGAEIVFDRIEVNSDLALIERRHQ